VVSACPVYVFEVPSADVIRIVSPAFGPGSLTVIVAVAAEAADIVPTPLNPYPPTSSKLLAIKVCPEVVVISEVILNCLKRVGLSRKLEDSVAAACPAKAILSICTLVGIGYSFIILLD
jgi:formylmethanofuran:tetrahydromethanopterin formyltransferase